MALEITKYIFVSYATILLIAGYEGLEKPDPCQMIGKAAPPMWLEN